MTPLLWILFAVLIWNVLLTLVPVVAVSLKETQTCLAAGSALICAELLSDSKTDRKPAS